MQSETVLASQRIYDGRVVHLRVDDVRTPRGLETRREIVEHHGAVAIVAIDDDDRVLLIKQYRHAVERVMTEIPAGTLEPDEDPTAAAARELIEETGYSAARIERIGGVFPSPGFCTEYIHLYEARELTPGPARPEDDENIEIEIVPWAEVMHRVQVGEIQDAKSIVALLLIAALRTES